MRCSNQNCDKEANYWLRCDGEKVPGSWVCKRHAIEVLTEYAEKLPPEMGKWDAVPVDELGQERVGEILAVSKRALELFRGKEER